MIVWAILSVLALTLTGCGFWSGSAWARSRTAADIDRAATEAYDQGWRDRDGERVWDSQPAALWDRDPAPTRPDDPDEWDEQSLAGLRDDAPDPDTATLLTARQVDRLRADHDPAAWRRCLERDRAEWMADLQLTVSDMAQDILSEPPPWDRKVA